MDAEKYSDLIKSLEQWIETISFDHLENNSKENYEELVDFPYDESMSPSQNYAEDPNSIVLFTQSLMPFYTAGFVLQSLQGHAHQAWWATGFFFKNNWLSVPIDQQIKIRSAPPATHLLQVKKAQANAALREFGLPDLKLSEEASSFLLRPTNTICLLLVTEVPAVFVQKKIELTHKFINKYFNL